MKNPFAEKKKKVIIVGAGLSGLTAGIYLLDNGFDVEIYEKHAIVGGECTGWTRKGTYIDGCAHWIVGTNPKSDLFPLWEHIGAFDKDTKIYPTEYITKFRMDDGRVFTFYADMKKLEEEMLSFFPDDRNRIKRFLSSIRAYQSIHIPVKKPLDYMNPLEFISFGIAMLPAALPFARYKHISVERYGKKFKNPELAEIISRFLSDNFNIHSFFYICQALSKNDAGMPEGGSLSMMQRVKENYLSKGGQLYLNKNVDKIHVVRNVAKGIILKGGETIDSDYVIAACDAAHVLNQLLQKKFYDEGFDAQFKDPKTNPIHTSVMVALRTNVPMDDFPKMYDVKCKPFDCLGLELNHFAIRNFAFDKTLKNLPGYTLLTVLLDSNAEVYDKLKRLDKDVYIKKKMEFGELMRHMIAENTDAPLDSMELLDVVTPLTYERYTNAYKGSYMAFDTTEDTKGLMRPGIIKGLSNFVLAGQWIMPPGGLPIALLSGKHAAMRICKANGNRFVCKEKKN